jgi:hypothetical protein
VNAVHGAPVDERDTQWELHQSTYRVFVYTGEAAANVEAYDFASAELLDVLAWASTKVRPSQMFAVAALLSDPQMGRGLVWLVGADPNGEPTNHTEAAMLKTMRERRG